MATKTAKFIVNIFHWFFCLLSLERAHCNITIINNPHFFCALQLLINPTSQTTTATNEIGYELGIIKSNFSREIAALKSAVSGDISMRQVSSSIISTRDAPSESIKSPAKWNERMQEISTSFDKFSSIIDDGKESNTDDRSEGTSCSMMKEIDNALRRNYVANGSIGRASSDVLLLPQDESFN